MNKASSLVLFDIDGTLMRGAGPYHKEALVRGIRRVTGIATTLDGLATAGTLDRDLIVQMLELQGQSKRKIRPILRQIMSECEKSYLENCTSDHQRFLCRGVKEILADLKSNGAAMALVSGNLAGIGWRKVELAGIRPFFSTGAFASDGRTRARLAQVAQWRALRLGLVAKSSRVSLIGDHPNDIQAAKANGYQSVGVATGVVTFEELARSAPDILVRDLSELDVLRLM